MRHVPIAACLALAVTLPAHAQFAKPEDAVKYRQSAMALKGAHLSRIFAMANGRVPFDATAAQDNAALLDTLDRISYAGFIEGTANVGNTRAKPEIWTERAKFDAAAKKSGEDIDKLKTAAATGSLEQLKAAAGAVGQSCKACHDAYQRPAN